MIRRRRRRRRILHRSAPPAILIRVPVAGAATAVAFATSYEEQQRLWRELAGRDLLGEIIDALHVLERALQDGEAA